MLRGGGRCIKQGGQKLAAKRAGDAGAPRVSCWCAVLTGMAAVSLLMAAHPTVASIVS